MAERIPNQEFSELEVRLIQKLKEKKEKWAEDQETRELLHGWLDGEEARADQINTSRANIKLNLRRAKVYCAAGFIDEARENLDAVMVQSSQEGEPDLYDQAVSMIEDIKRAQSLTTE